MTFWRRVKECWSRKFFVVQSYEEFRPDNSSVLAINREMFKMLLREDNVLIMWSVVFLFTFISRVILMTVIIKWSYPCRRARWCCGDVKSKQAAAFQIQARDAVSFWRLAYIQKFFFFVVLLNLTLFIIISLYYAAWPAQCTPLSMHL